MAQQTRRRGRKKAGKRVRKGSANRKREAIPRALLALEVRRRIETFGLSRNVAAVVVGDAASQMSRLMTGHANEFSAERLVSFLQRLGSNVTISIQHARRLGRRGKVRVRVD